MNRILNLQGIGNIILVKNKRARRLSVAVSYISGIKVTVPESMSFINAEKFVVDKRSWIKKNLDKIQKFKDNNTVFDANSEYSTRQHKLRIVTHEKNTIKIVIKNRQIYVFYPVYADIKDDRIQNAIRKSIIEAWRIEAKEYLPARVKELADRYGFKYNRISVKNARTRWGSCSSANNINLNLQLMRLPQHLADYIILHELVHTLHKNHGKSFWNLLENITGNAKGLNKEMKDYNLNYW